MVQLAPQAPDYNPDIDYWKLKDPAPLPRKQLLSSLGRDTIDGVPIDRFRAQAIRRERGLLIYESCDNDQLQKFCHERQLTTQSTDDKSLIETLKVADSRAMFRLLDLPPELRCNVYEWYFASLSMDHGAAPPPICQTSELIRQESLPLTQPYLRPALRIKSRSLSGTRETLHELRDEDFATTTEERAWPGHLFPDGHLDLKALQQLSINACFKIGSLPTMRFRWLIDRDEGSETFTIQSTQPREQFGCCAYGCPQNIHGDFDLHSEQFLKCVLSGVHPYGRAELNGLTTKSDFEEMIQTCILVTFIIPDVDCYQSCPSPVLAQYWNEILSKGFKSCCRRRREQSE